MYTTRLNFVFDTLQFKKIKFVLLQNTPKINSLSKVNGRRTCLSNHTI
jgi:hypothetical protein